MTTSNDTSASQPTKISSWFVLPSNPLSSMIEATRKATTAANNFVQKTVLSPNQTENDENSTPNQNQENKIVFSRVLTDFSSNLMKNAQQFKQIVEEKTFLGNFTREQEKFLAEKRFRESQDEKVSPPWVGHVDEERMKNEILKLSEDERNFVRNPPSGADFRFDLSNFSAMASFLLETDEKLRQMRFKLVPKQIKEEEFWQNYFYRVSLIENSIRLQSSSIDKSNSSLKSDVFQRKISETNEIDSNLTQEFVSDDFDTSAITMEDIRREIEEISGNSSGNKKAASSLDENEWDQGLTDEIENLSVEELEAQINQMLKKQEK